MIFWPFLLMKTGNLALKKAGVDVSFVIQDSDDFETTCTMHVVNCLITNRPGPQFID